MLGSTLLVFSWCPLNYDVTLKIINRLKINNNNLKFNGYFKRYITVGKTSREY